MIRNKILPYLERCKRLYAGSKYCVTFLCDRLQMYIEQTKDLNELKEKLMEAIDYFIMYKIVYA